MEELLRGQVLRFRELSRPKGSWAQGLRVWGVQQSQGSVLGDLGFQGFRVGALGLRVDVLEVFHGTFSGGDKEWRVRLNPDT